MTTPGEGAADGGGGGGGGTTGGPVGSLAPQRRESTGVGMEGALLPAVCFPPYWVGTQIEKRTSESISGF